MTDGAMQYVPTRIERMWRRLGFRYHLVDLPPEADAPGRGWMMTHVRLRFSFADRLRLLLSGNLTLDIRQSPNVDIADCISTASWRIVPPGERQA